MNQRNIKNYQLKLYLEGWLDNVGFDHRGIEFTLNNAMEDSASLIEWFKTDNIDYDEEFAIEFLRREYSEYKP